MSTPHPPRAWVTAQALEFDPSYNLRCDNLSQLVAESDDEFPVEVQVHHAVAPDPLSWKGHLTFIP